MRLCSRSILCTILVNISEGTHTTVVSRFWKLLVKYPMLNCTKFNNTSATRNSSFLLMFGIIHLNKSWGWDLFSLGIFSLNVQTVRWLLIMSDATYSDTGSIIILWQPLILSNLILSNLILIYFYDPLKHSSRHVIG